MWWEADWRRFFKELGAGVSADWLERHAHPPATHLPTLLYLFLRRPWKVMRPNPQQTEQIRRVGESERCTVIGWCDFRVTCLLALVRGHQSSFFVWMLAAAFELTKISHGFNKIVGGRFRWKRVLWRICGSLTLVFCHHRSNECTFSTPIFPQIACSTVMWLKEPSPLSFSLNWEAHNNSFFPFEASIKQVRILLYCLPRVRFGGNKLGGKKKRRFWSCVVPF